MKKILTIVSFLILSTVANAESKLQTIKKNGELHEKKYFDLRKTLIDINPSEDRLPLQGPYCEQQEPVGVSLSTG